jgi:hypothetical protein
MRDRFFASCSFENDCWGLEAGLILDRWDGTELTLRIVIGPFHFSTGVTIIKPKEYCECGDHD